MMYYSKKARMDAIDSIQNCMRKISETPAYVLDYTTARETNKFLSQLVDEIQKEQKKSEQISSR